MRFLTPVVAVIWLCTTGTWALHESDVGVVDWHKELIGVPLAGSLSTSPSFHRVDNKTLILAATASNVLAALEPEDGSILWRYVFNPEDRIGGYYKNKSVIATLSGPGGATLRAFGATRGELIFEKRLHHPAAGAPSEPTHIGQDIVFSSTSVDLYVLRNGCSVNALDGETGNIKWSWTAPDQGSLIVHTKLVLSANTLYAVGVAKSFASYTLHVTALNPSTGEVMRSSNIGANIVSPWTEFAVISHPSLLQPVALWLEKETLRYVSLTPALNEKPRSAKGSGYVRITDVGAGDHGQVVLIRQNGLGVVLHLEGDQTTTETIWEFENAAHSENNSESLYISGVDIDGRPYIGRICWSHSLQKGSADLFARHILQGQSTGFTFPYDNKQHGSITNVALDSDNPYERTVKSRLLLVTNTGAIQLWNQDELKWTREEGLSVISAAGFVEIPERAMSGASQEVESEGFFGRIKRQVYNAQDFPRYVVNFAIRFATGSYGTASTPAVSKGNSSEPISRDAFGFRQVIVAATGFGKIYGIDSSSGDIIWNRVLGLGRAEEIGGQIIPVKFYVTRMVSDGGDPEVVLVTQRKANDGLVETVIFHIDVLNGRNVIGNSTDDYKLQGEDVIAGPLVESFFLNTEAKTVILLDEFLQIYLYPDTALTQAAFKNVTQNLSFPLQSKSDRTSRVIGYQITSSDNNFRPVAHPTWSFTLGSGEGIQAILPPAARGPIVSFGKVLGNRTTLYKYLNPRLFTILTATPTKAVCGLYILDSMKGTVIYHAEVKASLRGCEMKTALIDNWLVYHYYDSEVGTGTAAGTKGYKMVSVEFYEGQKIDDRTRSLELSAFSGETVNFHTYEQAYILPHAVTALASTATRFGISNKDIILATNDHKVQYIPRVFLNPRRPKRKPTAEEQEEMLIEYAPIIPIDPKRVLSHNYEVSNVQKILTAPALLESTSLIFAYGLDMFLTRLAPSGTFDVLSENFNKMQLVFTVCGLFVAILITKTMVRRKQLREKWYQ